MKPYICPCRSLISSFFCCILCSNLRFDSCVSLFTIIIFWTPLLKWVRESLNLRGVISEPESTYWPDCSLYESGLGVFCMEFGVFCIEFSSRCSAYFLFYSSSMLVRVEFTRGGFLVSSSFFISFLFVSVEVGSLWLDLSVNCYILCIAGLFLNKDLAVGVISFIKSLVYSA